MTMHTVFLLLAFICFVIAATGMPVRFGIGWLGLAFWVLTLLT